MGLASCAIVGPDEDGIARTYPDASDFEHVSFPALLEDVPAPADYNVVLYVTEHHICPENMMCFPPDGIIVAETPKPESEETSLFIPAKAPQQFQLKIPYLFSVHASDHDLDKKTRHRVRLLGYSRMP